MLIYLLLIASISFLGVFFSKKYRKAYVIAICILMSLIAGLRHSTIGNDTGNYQRIFSEAAVYQGELFERTRMEPGYSILNIIFAGTGMGYNAFIFIMALVTNIAISSLIFKKSKYPMLSFLLFVLFRFFFDEMNIMRQFLSISIVLFGFDYVEQRKFLKYLFVVLLATSIHYSAFFALILYFVYRDHFSKNMRIGICCVTLLIMVFLGDLLNMITANLGIYDGYINKYMDSNRVGSILKFILAIGTYLYCRIIYSRHKNEIQNKEWYGFLLNISLIASMLSLCSIRISIMDRLIEYFNIFLIISIPNFTALVRTGKKRLMAIVAIMIISIVYFTVVTAFRPNWNKVVPYRFFWEHNEDNYTMATYEVNDIEGLV